MSPVLPSAFLLPLCRAGGRFSSRVLAPRNLLVAEGRGGEAVRGRGLTCPADRCPQLPWLPATPRPRPGEPLSSSPVSTSRHVLKPKVTGMNAWLPLLSSAPLAEPFTPHATLLRRVRAPPAPPIHGRSCQTPEFQGDPWPTQSSHPSSPSSPGFPGSPASLVTPRLPRFPRFPRFPWAPPSYPHPHPRPVPHPSPGFF